MKKKIVILVVILIFAVLLGIAIYKRCSLSDEKTDLTPVDEPNSEAEESAESQKPEKTAEPIESEPEVKPTEKPLVAPPEDTSPPVVITPKPEPDPYTSFESYNNMSPEEQEAFYNTFESPDAFFNWYNQAKAEYDSSRNDIIIDGSTNIEMKP